MVSGVIEEYGGWDGNRGRLWYPMGGGGSTKVTSARNRGKRHTWTLGADCPGGILGWRTSSPHDRRHCKCAFRVACAKDRSCERRSEMSTRAKYERTVPPTRG